MSDVENEADVKAYQSQWAKAANRRLEAIRNGEVAPGAWAKEAATDLNARRAEQAMQPTGNWGYMGQSDNKMTKARLLDWEAAQKDAKDPSKPLPNLDGYALPNQ